MLTPTFFLDGEEARANSAGLVKLTVREALARLSEAGFSPELGAALPLMKTDGVALDRAFSDWLVDVAEAAEIWAAGPPSRIEHRKHVEVLRAGSSLYRALHSALHATAAPEEADALVGHSAEAGIMLGFAAALAFGPGAGVLMAKGRWGGEDSRPGWYADGLRIAREMREADPRKETASIAEVISEELRPTFPRLPKVASIETRIGRWEAAGDVPRRATG